jgi:hypothetical protein
MRYIFVTPHGVIDTLTGELSDRPSVEQLLSERPGGIIAGRNLYPVLAPLVNEARSDIGFSATIVTQRKRQVGDRVGGIIYLSHLYYRYPKDRSKTVLVKTEYGLVPRTTRFRPTSIKWLVLNLELFCETEDIEGAARALVDLAERRGVKPRYSPGAYGSAMLRASPKWESGRHAAPWFISEIARNELPGNFYVLRSGYRRAERAYYLDQKSSHHNIASTITLPHPHYLRARGRLRAVERERYPIWIKPSELDILNRHVGLLCVMMEISKIPTQLSHLYPPWAQQPGRRHIWLWTPELRLLDRLTRLQWVSAGLTSFMPDPALREYADWSLDYLSSDPHSVVKPALLAAYGMLGVKSTDTIERYSVHGRGKPPHADVCRLPLIDHVYRSTINRRRAPVLQNVVARGVIEAETRTRSLEFARQLESEQHPVIQIYADGLLTTASQLPFMPEGWRVAGELTRVSSPHPNSILSSQMVRLPGIPGGRRAARILAPDPLTSKPDAVD